MRTKNLVRSAIAFALLATAVLAASPAVRQIGVIAHRGAMDRAPENTLPAFSLAIEDGADWIETDLRTTADGGLILMHDARVNRTTNDTGLVGEMTLAEIRALDAGVKFDSSFAGTRVPTADEAFALIRRAPAVGIDLDVKSAAPDSVVALIRRHDMFDRVIVYAGIRSLARMRDLEPRTRLKVPRPPKDPADFAAVVARVRPAVFGSSHGEIDSATTAACHAAGALVGVNNMSADHPDGWAYTIDRGGDMLQTNHAAALVAWLRSRGMHR